MRHGRTIRITLAVGAAGLWCACGRDARLAGQKLHTATVKTVSYYGVNLDPNATPEQVAFVALRAIREDALAADSAEREAALDKQFDVCAANVIAGKNPSSLPRDEYVHGVVYHWTPTVAHYARELETEWAKASPRLVRRGPTAPKDAKEGAAECDVLMQLADPSGDPNASVVLVVWMVQDAGYWRVAHLGFDPTRRTLGNS